MGMNSSNREDYSYIKDENHLSILRGSPVSRFRRRLQKIKTTQMTNFSDLINRQSEPPSSKSTGIPTASSFTDYSSDGQVCLLVDSPYRILKVSFFNELYMVNFYGNTFFFNFIGHRRNFFLLIFDKCIVIEYFIIITIIIIIIINIAVSFKIVAMT